MRHEKNVGFSLIEIMVATGLVSILGLGVSSAIQNMKKGVRGVQSSGELIQAASGIQLTLNNASRCAAALRNGSGPAVFNSSAPAVESVSSNSIDRIVHGGLPNASAIVQEGIYVGEYNVESIRLDRVSDPIPVNLDTQLETLADLSINYRRPAGSLATAGLGTVPELQKKYRLSVTTANQPGPQPIIACRGVADSDITATVCLAWGGEYQALASPPCLFKKFGAANSVVSRDLGLSSLPEPTGIFSEGVIQTNSYFRSLSRDDDPLLWKRAINSDAYTNTTWRSGWLSFNRGRGNPENLQTINPGDVLGIVSAKGYNEVNPTNFSQGMIRFRAGASWSDVDRPGKIEIFTASSGLGVNPAAPGTPAVAIDSDQSVQIAGPLSVKSTSAGVTQHFTVDPAAVGIPSAGSSTEVGSFLSASIGGKAKWKNLEPWTSGRYFHTTSQSCRLDDVPGALTSVNNNIGPAEAAGVKIGGYSVKVDLTSLAASGASPKKLIFCAVSRVRHDVGDNNFDRNWLPTFPGGEVRRAGHGGARCMVSYEVDHWELSASSWNGHPTLGGCGGAGHLDTGCFPASASGDTGPGGVQGTGQEGQCVECQAVCLATD